MNNPFFTSPLSPEEARRRLAMQQNRQQGQPLMTMGAGAGAGAGADAGADMGMDLVSPADNAGGLHHGDSLAAAQDLPVPGGDSLHGIAGQDAHEVHRRLSVPQLFSHTLPPQTSGRRMSVMDYTHDYGALDAVADPHAAATMAPGLGGLAGSAAFSAPPDAFPAAPEPALMAMPGQTGLAGLPPDTVGSSMPAFSDLNMAPIAAGPGPVSLFDPRHPTTECPTAALDPVVSPDFPMDMGVEGTTANEPSVAPVTGFALGGDSEMTGTGEGYDILPVPPEPPGLLLDPGPGPFPALAATTPQPRELSAPASFRSPTSGVSRTISQTSVSQPDLATATPASTAPQPSTLSTPVSAGPVQLDTRSKDVYSKSGFDMLRALWYVATRKNPTVEIGAVDMSCAFLVCDVTLNDCPIIYVSDNFQNLTGYNRHEIVGQNCRFLQSPDGRVEAGSKREFVDNDAVFKLKKAFDERREIQQSLINYRKGGKPFLNLLTMIPIPWETDEIRYYIGFQIDLVECPEAISGQETTGAMQVNYRHSDVGQHIWVPPSTTRWDRGGGRTLDADEVSSLVQLLDPRSSPSDWPRQSWDKMLLENTDDMVHALSLKGVFVCVSASCKKVLEYDVDDLLGTSLSSICHPSDIISVTRELRDAQPDVPVNMAFRIRRKHSGYTWFESFGTLLHEQAKGRKYIILVGRQRPVFALRRRDVDAHGGGIGDSEFWTKLSTGGLLLYVPSTVRALLDLQPADLEGTSMQDLMRRESRAEFGRTIEKARKGAIISFKHEVLHKKGQLLPAQTTFYPGDGTPPGQKPTFLIAQTKIFKSSSRAAVSAGGSEKARQPSAAVSTASAAAAATAPESQQAGDTEAEAEDDDIFSELHTTRCASWQYELRQMEKANRALAEELAQLVAGRRKRKRRKAAAGAGGGGGGTPAASGSGSGEGGGSGSVGSGGGSDVDPVVLRECANCHTRDTPEWRRGPSGKRDLCNGCGLRWAKLVCFFFFLFLFFFELWAEPNS